MWFRVLAATALLTQLPACLDIPAFSPPDGPPGDDDDDTTTADVTLQSAGEQNTVSGGTFSIHFPATGYHYPDRITIAGVNVVTTDTPKSCDQPDGGGIGLSPSDAVDGMSANGPASITALVAGPALVELELTWQATPSCMVPAVISGRSIFSITPDGRVVRYDSIQAPQMPLQASSCPCDPNGMPPTTWSVRSELVVETDRLPLLTDSQMRPIDPSDTQPADQVLCASGPTGSIGFGFQRPQVRVRTIDQRATAFSYDFLQGLTPSLDDNSKLDPTSTAYLLGDSAACSAAVSKLQAFGTDPLLTVDGLDVSTGVDGVYGGNDGADKVGAPAHETTTLTARTKPIPAGAVVWLDFGVPHGTFQVTSPKQTGTSWFKISQPDPAKSQQAVFWFRDAIAVGDTITITAGND